MDIEREIDRLYQLPLGEFTAERNALARRAGDRAADVRALSKPPVPAWAVNQLFWQQRKLYDALIEAATTMRAAHGAVLSGKRADLRTSGREHDDAIERALKTAIDLLQQSGNPVTDATRQAIATTLRGLPSDEAPGRLTRVLQPGGFEMLAGIPVKSSPAGAKSRVGSGAAPAPAPRQGRASAATHSEQPDEKARARAREAVDAAARALRLAEQNARREEFEAARAAREAEKAERALDSAREEVDAAQRAAEDAANRAKEAQRRKERAEGRARESEGAVDAARKALAEAEKAQRKAAGRR